MAAWPRTVVAGATTRQEPIAALARLALRLLNTFMADTEITTRPAHLTDMAVIGEIVAQSWQQTFSGLLPQNFLGSITPGAQKVRHEQTFVRDGVHYRGALRAEEVVGFVSWGAGRAPGVSIPFELYALYLRPTFERQGIGRLLFEEVISDVSSRGSPGLYLTALAVNPNREFYVRLGGAEADAPDIRLGDASYGQVGFIWYFVQ